ncbi:ATP-binding protein [Sediminibacillus massiliensis]|uniref:ATP-binding protein n=1 Tax=Sediminibacillus massiliensis TaxID=1926277 RepID=UPI0011775121|nr:ATP-binding protein [Sediminibacillus massiliensis]
MITEINGKKIDFHQLLQHSITAKFILRGNEIVYANNACLRLLKAEDPEQILYQSIDTFLHPDYTSLSSWRLNKVFEEETMLDPVEYKIIDITGEIVDVETYVGPFYFGDEVLAQVIVTDITEKKKMQELIMQTEKMSVMGELAASIIHEIRNPLTILNGFIEIMNIETTPRGKEYLSVMADEVKRIESIANDLLLFSKPRPQILNPKNIVKVIKDVIFLMNNTAFKKGVMLNFHHEEDHIEILCDEMQLKQAFINFIKNAIEATPAEGEINIYLRKNSANNKLCIEIADTGCGIPEDKLKEIGSSFFTTKQNGTGLGLTVTYNIIKSHHGSISVESKLNEGTTFTIDLPYQVS